MSVINGCGAIDKRPIEIKIDNTRSVLGIIWDHITDTIRFTVSDESFQMDVTKRVIISELAKLFDPTGLLAPFITHGKVLIRELWMKGIDWDVLIKGDPLDSSWHIARQ